MHHRTVETSLCPLPTDRGHVLRAGLFALATLTLACARPPLRYATGPLESENRAEALIAIDTMTLRHVARTLSSDEMAGRRTGTPDADRAADFIAAECRRLGLLPAAGDDYFQTVPLVEAHVDSIGSTVRIVGPKKDTTFVYWEEFIPDIGTASTLRSFSGPLTYVGRAPDILFRRSNLPDLHGQVALLRGEFGGSGEAADTLLARGAVGVIEVVDDANRYRLYRQTRGRTRLHHADSTVQSSVIPPFPTIMAGPRMTVTLYEELTGVTHGSWNDAYLNGLAANLPEPQRLDGWRAEVQLRVTPTPRTTRNVACVLPGRTAMADTAIAVTAHYDHLGIGVPDQAGDSIYNGFTDNASGVAMSLAVAEALLKDKAAGAGLERSVLFLFFSGEEQGLLGSDWWVAHPQWPLARTAGVLNLDANVPAGIATRWRIAGADDGPLVRMVERELQKAGWETSVAPPSPGSDYYPFHRRGIPSVFFVPSDGAYVGKTDAESDSMRASIWSRYHRPHDHYRESFPFDGLAQYAQLTRQVLQAWDRVLDGRRTAAGASSVPLPGSR